MRQAGGQATFGAMQARMSSWEPGTSQGEPEVPCPVLPLHTLVWLWGQQAWYRPSGGSQQLQMSETGKKSCQLVAAPTIILKG